MTERKRLVIIVSFFVCAFSIYATVQAHASTGSGFFCVERPWACDYEYPPWVVRETVRAPVLHGIKGHGPGLRDLIPALAAKVGEIIDRCGSQLISGYRAHARVAGTGHPSLHSVYPARAADLKGNPSCMYALLGNWSGGYSTDYTHVKHLHLSFSPPGSGYLGGREWGMHFVHGGHHRYAHSHHRKQLRG
jgi:hypothetical protein